MKDRVDFGSQVFLVELVDKLGGKAQGEIRPQECKIRIESALNPQAQIMTLWHEIIHQLLNKCGHDNEEFINPKLEETLIEGLTDGIVTVLRLNPWLGDIE